jgi:hypothetical protein
MRLSALYDYLTATGADAARIDARDTGAWRKAAQAVSRKLGSSFLSDVP